MSLRKSIRTLLFNGTLYTDMTFSNFLFFISFGHFQFFYCPFHVHKLKKIEEKIKIEKRVSLKRKTCLLSIHISFTYMKSKSILFNFHFQNFIFSSNLGSFQFVNCPFHLYLCIYEYLYDSFCPLRFKICFVWTYIFSL